MKFVVDLFFNGLNVWQWIFWVGPLIGAAVAAAYHQYLLRAGGFRLKNSESLRSHPTSAI